MTGGASASLTRRALFPVVGAGALAASVSPAAGQSAPPQGLDAGSTGITLDPGIHRVDANMTIRADIQLRPGAQIVVAEGRTLTVTGHFAAPVSHVFTGPGRVDLNGSATPAAYPEWWGAGRNNGAVDSVPAFAACLAAHPVMMLGACDYYFAQTFVIERPFARIWGSGYRGYLPGMGTRLILTRGAGDVIRVGPLTKPANVNAHLQGVDLRWVHLIRTLPVEARSGASPRERPAGLRAQFLLCCRFEGISSSEHATGFFARGLVRSHFIDCLAFRSIPGQRRDTPFCGFYLDGLDDLGLAGGNASLFLHDCNVSTGGTPGVADPVGLLLEGGFADTFVTNFETGAIASGIRVDGQTARLGSRAISGHANLHIRTPIIDQCATGIEIRDTSGHAQIEIAQPYVALAPGGAAAIRFDRMRGAVSILGGQLLGRMGSQNGGRSVGVEAIDSAGIATVGLKMIDCRRPLMFERCTGSALAGWIGNPSVKAAGAAVTLSKCSRSTVRMQVTGMGSAFAAGVSVTGGSAHLDVTGLDPAAIAKGRTNFVLSSERSIEIPVRQSDVTIG